MQYLLEVKESVIAGFEWATGCGPLAEEEMMQVTLNPDLNPDPHSNLNPNPRPYTVTLTRTP